MKKRLAGFVLVSSVMMSTVFADVASDLKSGLPLDVVLQNAINAGGTINSATTEMVELMPGRGGDVVTMAISVCGDAACKESVVQSALVAGADPAEVLAATAAPRFGSRPTGMTRQQLREARARQRNDNRWTRPSGRTNPLASYY